MENTEKAPIRGKICAGVLDELSDRYRYDLSVENRRGLDFIRTDTIVRVTGLREGDRE